MKFLFFILTFLPLVAFAQAQVFPTRLTLTEEAPSSYLTLRNSTPKPQKFKIELMQLAMKKDGSVASIHNDQNPLVDDIKFSPKSIEIAPNDKQVVRIMMTSFEGLSDGDSNIYLHFIPEGSNEAKSNAKFSLQARIAVAVPIIVRHGTPKLDAKMKDAKALKDKSGNLKVSFEATNTTKYFLTGDLEISAVTPKGDVSLSKILSISSYIPSRIVSVDIKKEEITAKIPEADVSKLKIHYYSNNDRGAPFDLSSEVTPAFVSKSNKRR